MMFTALFLICNMATGECIQSAPPQYVFPTREECESAAGELQDRLPTEPSVMVLAQCVGWGSAT